MLRQIPKKKVDQKLTNQLDSLRPHQTQAFFLQSEKLPYPPDAHSRIAD
jgi:hypothetical protein